MARPPAYTPDELMRLQSLWENGEPDAMIAKHLGRPVQGVRSRRFDSGFINRMNQPLFFRTKASTRHTSEYRANYFSRLKLFRSEPFLGLEDQIAVIQDKLLIPPDIVIDREIEVECSVDGCNNRYRPLYLFREVIAVHLVCTECRESGFNVLQTQGKGRKTKCPICPSFVYAISNSSWRTHYYGAHRELDWDVYKKKLYEAEFWREAENRGFFDSDRFEGGYFPYHSKSELAAALFLLAEYPSLSFKKLPSSPKKNSFRIWMPNLGKFFCPDFAGFEGANLKLLAECKGEQQPHYEEKRHALETECKRLGVKSVWLAAGKSPIDLGSSYFRAAVAHHAAHANEIQLIERLGKTALWHKTANRFISQEDYNELFSVKCAVCKRDMFTRHPENKQHYCGGRGLLCGRNVELEAQELRICRSCAEPVPQPLSNFPPDGTNKGYVCIPCLRKVQGKTLKACARPGCRKVLQLNNKTKLCDECRDERAKCDGCGIDFVPPHTVQRANQREGKKSFHSHDCFLKYKATIRYEPKCFWCKKTFTAKTRSSAYCDDCRMIECASCRQPFLAWPQIMQKIKKAMKGRGDYQRFLKFRDGRYRCDKCLTRNEADER